MIEGIILAAGLSSRAKTNKLLLTLNGKPLIRYTIEAMKPFVNKIVVVTGRFHDELLPYLNDVEVVKNENYERGMFSSVLTGLDYVSDDFFLIPGDIPFVSSKVYLSLLNGKGSIRIPIVNKKSGHPVFMEKENISKILKESIDSNLHKYISKNEVNYVNVEDENCLLDIDTLDDLKTFEEKMKGASL